MSSRGGLRAVGTDGTDFKHRQRISSNIKLSVQYKFYLKLLFVAHFFVLLTMWVKVVGELLFNDFKIFSKPRIWINLDLPSAYPWEYVWCLSFVPILIALASFPKNKLKLISYHFYAQFLFGILPCCIGLGGQLPELWDYLAKKEQSKTPTFNGNFPMVILWYIFFLIAFQIHGFAMYFTYYLTLFWQRDISSEPKKSN